MQTARDILNHHRIRCTRQRERIYQSLASTKSHPTAEELHRMVLPECPGTSLATIYNTLDALCEAGLCRRIPTPDGFARFDADVSEHVHAFTREGGMIDVPEDLSTRIMQCLPPGIIEELESRMGVSVGKIVIDRAV